MSITFVHLTGRKDPKWEWYADAICNQATPEELRSWQFVFVDRILWALAPQSSPVNESEVAFADPFYHNAERRAELARIVNGRFRYSHIPTLPNVYQGPFRKTTKDFFFAGVARNTGIIAARHPYVMFCDDLALPSPQWLSQVRHAAANKYLLAGMYAKRLKMVVEHGILASSEDYPGGIDSRMPHGSDGGIVPWSGAGLFGCSFGVPLENLLAVDGCGYEVAAQGADDYDLGFRLERTGLTVYLNKNCFTTESEEAHHLDEVLPRESKLVSPEALPPGYDGNPMSDHVHLNRLRREIDRTLPLYPMGLRAIRDSFLATGMVPIPKGPEDDWRTGEPLGFL